VKRRLAHAAIALGAGVLLFLSCADFDVWPLTWFAIVPLLAVVLDERTRRPWVYGFLCGLTANGGGFYWIVGFLERFGHLPLVAALPIFALLISYQAITFALFAWMVRRLDERLHLGMTFTAPVVYVAVELVVPYVFPWYLAITQAWVRPVIQVADLTGPLGVSFLLVMVNGALYDLYAAMRNKLPVPRRRVGVAVAVMVACLAYGQVRIHQVERARVAAPKLAVGVVQANIGIHEKFHPALAERQLELHQRLSVELERRGAQLIVWPESSYPYLFRRDQSRDWPIDDPARVQRGFSTPVLFGSLTVGRPPSDAYNTALLLDRDGDVRGKFDKNILMVFGEYIPYYEQLKWVRRFIPEMSNFGRGTDVELFPLALPSGDTAWLAPMICYEDIFPSFGRRLAQKQAGAPNLLVNITNDAWFGRTSEPYEHLALSVYRSVELRLDLVRAVNTGVSAFVDSTGRVYQRGPAVDPDEGVEPPAPVTLLDAAALQRPFTVFATLGEWFGAACLAVLVLLGLRARRLAGLPIRWALVARGAALLAATIVVGLLASGGQLALGLNLLLHRNIPGVHQSTALADLAFSTGLRLVAAAALGCALAGVALARQARDDHRRAPPAAQGRRARAPVESALAVLAVLVAPALALGRLEGEQAGLVIGALAGIGVALAAGRLYSRRRRRA
jgi:apolipoprotein N-acyltransferase